MEDFNTSCKWMHFLQLQPRLAKKLQFWRETTECCCYSTTLALSQLQELNKRDIGANIKWQRLKIISRRNSRSAKDVNSIRKRLRRLVSSAHILTTPTPVSSMISLATVLQNLACKETTHRFLLQCWMCCLTDVKVCRTVATYLWFKYYQHVWHEGRIRFRIRGCDFTVRSNVLYNAHTISCITFRSSMALLPSYTATKFFLHSFEFSIWYSKNRR